MRLPPNLAILVVLQPATPTPAPTLLSAQVTFHNEKNGFCVLRVRYFETELFPDPSR